ncbi:hypothetical protein AB205_0086040 [Aquarana catesbeiana]|uniref:Transcription factor IIIC subunit 5 HTH domain-containing protein n=1 Tax=Aquarana catesbeiana TaxID=8400 RepID=A0A2G9RU65_AQUCT|nr:hypothetical protein AB205_0086040 [Aquarana catesbeiana]
MIRLFSIRPIWSRNAIKANVSVHPDKLKLLLPYMAYYMLTGPWRSLWVRFGYDPRKNPEAKIYQVLDFRIRCGMKYGYAPNEMPVKAKRSTYNYSLPITLKKPGILSPIPGALAADICVTTALLTSLDSRTVPQPISVQDLTQGLATSSIQGSKKILSNKYKLKTYYGASVVGYVFSAPASTAKPPLTAQRGIGSERLQKKDSVYIFQEGSLPPYRQMFYQLCDIHVESLQEIIRRNDGAETECTERDGWCLPKTSEQLRDSMCLMIKQIIRSKRPDLIRSASDGSGRRAICLLLADRTGSDVSRHVSADIRRSIG